MASKERIFFDTQADCFFLLNRKSGKTDMIHFFMESFASRQLQIDMFSYIPYSINVKMIKINIKVCIINHLNLFIIVCVFHSTLTRGSSSPVTAGQARDISIPCEGETIEAAIDSSTTIRDRVNIFDEAVFHRIWGPAVDNCIKR